MARVKTHKTLTKTFKYPARAQRIINKFESKYDIKVSCETHIKYNCITGDKEMPRSRAPKKPKKSTTGSKKKTSSSSEHKKYAQK
jgi:hypothetical protein